MDKNYNPAKKELDDFWAEYLKQNRDDKIRAWERMIYWDFKNSYKLELLDHFTPRTYEYMKSKDPNIHEIIDEVIERFNDFIAGDDETKIEIRNRMKIDE